MTQYAQSYCVLMSENTSLCGLTLIQSSPTPSPSAGHLWGSRNLPAADDHLLRVGSRILCLLGAYSLFLLFDDGMFLQVVSCLTALEELCPSRKEYDTLCFLLTQPTLASDPNYSDWNPSSARLRCFSEVDHLHIATNK